MKKVFLSVFAATLIFGMGVAQNPYMPLWEHIPDGEPYVFEDPDNAGQYRVYVYGSHDLLEWEYCGMDQVVWSAPVTNLTDWRCDRIIFESKNDRDGKHMNGNPMGDLLFAPDVAVKTLPNGQKEYYFYPNNQAKGRETMVAKSNRPDGPFTVCNWDPQNPARTVGCLGFDPAVFVDDDGRVYGYWGFQRHYAAELDPNTMASVKPGTEIIEDMVSNLHQSGDFRFFEASSIRKIEDKYVFIYSRWSAEGEWGLPGTCYTLAYAYSDHPLGPWTYGGTIIDGRGRDKDEKGNTIYTAYCTGNTHGSLCQINDQWWVFYHRHTGTDVYSRQAMVAPVSVTVEPGLGGKVTISEAEHTSEGFRIEGLDPLQPAQAGWACYLTGPDGMTQDYPNYSFSGPYILANRRGNEPGNPIVHNTSGSVVGYKYFNFDKTKDCTSLSLTATMRPQGINGYVDIYLDAPTSTKGGKKLGTIFIPREDEQVPQSYSTPLHGLLGVEGKHALYFVFYAEIKEQSIATLYDFQIKDHSAQEATINPYLQNPQPTSMTVMWLSTSDAQTGWVEYGEQNLDKLAREEKNGIRQAYNKVNRVTLTDLKPGTTYSYRVVARNIDKVTNNSLVYTSTEYSDVFTFTTPSERPSSVSMLVFTDIHTKTSVPNELVTKNGLKIEDQDFIFFNGDMMHSIESHEAIRQYLTDPYSQLFASHLPFMFSRGNHDLRNRYARHLEDYVTTPGTKDGHPFYYSFTWGPCFFVVLDAGEDKEDTDYEYGGLISCESYRETQASWLQAQLQSKAAKQASFRVVVMHIPAFKNYDTNERYTPGRIRDLYLNIMNRNKVDVLLCGHTHHASVLQANDQHRFPIVINGGDGLTPQEEFYCPSVIRFHADKRTMNIDLLDYYQRNQGSLTIKH